MKIYEVVYRGMVIGDIEARNEKEALAKANQRFTTTSVNKITVRESQGLVPNPEAK